MRPACACPHCGWESFWQDENAPQDSGSTIQCERCGALLTEAALVLGTGPRDDGLSIVWSRVNQGWFVMWGTGTVLRVVNDRAEAEAIVADLRRPR
jgi:NAD-dependent SIR2 family protein deacetylase